MSVAPEAADLADLLALADVPAAPSAKRPRLSTTSTTSSVPDLTIEPLSGIRIRPESRKLDREALRALSSTFDFRRLDQIPGMLRGATPLPTAWLTIAVLVDKGPTKPTNGGGGQFCVWKLSDLKRGSSATTVPVFLFGEACSGAWKELPGTAFALLAAKAVPRKDGADAGAEEAALSIDKLQQLQRIGHASEFAFCKAERRDGKPCSMWVNKEECEYCEYHVGAALRQANRAAAAPKRAPKDAGAMPPSSSHGGGSSAGVPLGAIGGVPSTLSDSRPSRPSWSAANMQKPHSEADIARAALILRESGFTFQPPDPNSSDPFKHQFKVLPKAAVAPRPASAPASAKPIPSTVATSCVRGSADVGLGVHRGLSGSVDMASRGSSFLQAFGSIDRHAKEKVLQAKPTGAASEREAAREELDRRLGTLSKKDELHEKAQTVSVIEVTAYKCLQCAYFAEKARRECRELGHQLQGVKVKKRFFSCRRCKEHTSALNRRLPDGACRKCGSTDWKEAGLKRSTAAPPPSAEFLPRGEEVGKFRNSVPAPSYATGDAVTDAATGGALDDRRNHNAWQSSMPTWDET